MITLKPLQPFMFGGDNTYGKIGDKENGTYNATSRLYPQQSSILGMLKKELMIQSGVLTRKKKGEWVDGHQTQNAINLVGNEKFDISKKILQNFGSIKNISPVFLQKEDKIIIKKSNLRKYPLKKNEDNYLLEGFTAKDDIFDNFETLDGTEAYKTEDIFRFVDQTLNQKEANENSLFKKTSCSLKDGFSFVIFLECDNEVKNSIVILGADRSSFLMEVKTSNETLSFKTTYHTLLSDSLITLPLKGNCDFAITSEISCRTLIGKKWVNNDKHSPNHGFKKSDKVYLYEKGSIFVNPSKELINNLNNENLQQIGYNIYTTGDMK